MEWLRDILSQELAINLVVSVLVAASLIAARIITLRVVGRHSRAPVAALQRWKVTSRNVVMFLVIISTAMIWASELRTLALSLVAVAAAIVIAFKELILCFVGGLMRTSGRLFSVGDRIEIAGTRGDVVDLGLLTTTILEVGPGDLSHQLTGRAVVMPNAIFFSSPLINETFTDAFVLHTFTVPVSRDAKWHQHEAALLEAARITCQPFFDDAGRHFARVAREVGIETPNVEPRVTLKPVDPDKLSLVVRVPLPARNKGRIEQTILRSYLEKVEGSAAA